MSTEFTYNSSNGGTRKLPLRLVSEVRAHLVKCGFNKDCSKGELNQMLFDFRSSDGHPMMINQLEPIFTYISLHGELWPTEATP